LLNIVRIDRSARIQGVNPLTPMPSARRAGAKYVESA
jgi:hypothetical protein